MRALRIELPARDVHRERIVIATKEPRGRKELAMLAAIA
jgi:hypothetical protein